MTTISVTIVEGQDQLKIEGEADVVRGMITEWRARIDYVRNESFALMEKMQHAQRTLGTPPGMGGGAYSAPAGPVGPVGPTVSPFKPRVS